MAKKGNGPKRTETVMAFVNTDRVLDKIKRDTKSATTTIRGAIDECPEEVDDINRYLEEIQMNCTRINQIMTRL